MSGEVGNSAVEKKVEKVESVSLKPIVRTSWLPKGHDGEFKFTGCETWLVPFKNGQTGQRNTGLTEEDERRLEIKLRLTVGTLNRYNEDYWGKYKVMIPKEGKILMLDNPKDELDYLTLKANPLIANSLMEVADSPGATHYLSSVAKEAEVDNIKEKSERSAIKKFGQYSSKEMLDVLKIYTQLEGKAAAKLTTSTPVDLIETTLYNKLKADPEEFLRISNDPSFKTRVLIDDLVSARVLIKTGSKYIVNGGDTVGATLQDTIDFLENPSNQDVLISLKGKLEAVK